MNIVSFAWSPDGMQFLAVTSVSSDPYYAYGLMTPRLLSAADGSVLKTLLEKPAAIGEIAWSPDGRLVAFEYADGGLSLLNSLMVHELDGDAAWNATASLDPTLSGFFFSADSKSLIAHVIERTDSSLYRLSVDGKRATLIGQPGRVLSGPMVPSKDRRLFATVSSTTDQPPDPTVVKVDGLKTQIVANVNPQVKEWGLGEQEVVTWKSPEGPAIEGVLFRSPLVPKRCSRTFAGIAARWPRFCDHQLVQFMGTLFCVTRFIGIAAQLPGWPGLRFRLLRG